MKWRENPWARRRLSSIEAEEELLEPQKDEEIPKRQVFLKAYELIGPKKRTNRGIKGKRLTGAGVD